MHIYIKNIKIANISSIGSLNIGKTILCHNRASETDIHTTDIQHTTDQRKTEETFGPSSSVPPVTAPPTGPDSGPVSGP